MHYVKSVAFAQYPAVRISRVSAGDSNLFQTPAIVVSLQDYIENLFVFSDVVTYSLVSPPADFKNQGSQIVNISAWLTDFPCNMLLLHNAPQ